MASTQLPCPAKQPQRHSLQPNLKKLHPTLTPSSKPPTPQTLKPILLSIQIRRNDLQYKDSFTSASNSHAAIDDLIGNSESIYIATDETSSGFFDDFEKHGHKTYRYKDFFTDKGGKVLEGVSAAMDPKLVGLIEQVITRPKA